jgi:hypothetical protein
MTVRYYRPIGAEGFEFVNFTTPEAEELIAELGCGADKANIGMIEVDLISAEDCTSLSRSDFPWWGYQALIFRDGARSAFAGFLQGQGEWHRLRWSAEGCAFLFLPEVIDALDHPRSEVRWFPDGGMMFVRHPVLIEELLMGKDILRLPGRAGSVCVSQHFVDAYRSARLSGLDFEPLEVVSTGV